MMPRQLTTGAGWRRKTKGQELHAIQTFTQTGEVFKIHPVNAIHRTGLDGFLNAGGAVTVLTDGTRSAQVWLDHKRVGGNVSAVATTNTDRFVHPHGFLAESAPQGGLITRSVFSNGN